MNFFYATWLNLLGKHSEQQKYQNVIIVAIGSPPPACVGKSFWNRHHNLSVETMKKHSNTLREGLQNNLITVYFNPTWLFYLL